MPSTTVEAPSLLDDLMLQQELVRCVESKTSRAVRGLEIDCCDGRVRVTGRSRTYYVKQLVTQAILSTCPEADLENEIHVCAG